MESRKILFFIVEGVSDHSAIAQALEKIFNSNKVTVRIVGGDLTSEKGSTPQNIQNKIVTQIKNEMGKSFTPKDFAEVIQLVDLDGVFIPLDKIKEGTESVFYGEDEIICKNREDIVKRNIQKSSIINKLIKMPKVWKSIPYSIYFFSSNLDHVLHNNSNLSESEKEPLATNFAKRYENNPDGFIEFFSESVFSIKNSYEESWEFIKLNSNSLKRYTNFGLLFGEKAKNKI